MRGSGLSRGKEAFQPATFVTNGSNGTNRRGVVHMADERKGFPIERLAARPLHFIWICDCSGSMAGSKIQTLNVAIHEAIPEMRRVSGENPHADFLIRVIKFSDGAQWHTTQPVPVADFQWTDLSADGVTDMGKALAMVAEQLKSPPMTAHALPPVL